MDDLVKLKANSTAVRAALCFAVLLVLAVSWFAVRAQLGNMLAELTSPAGPNSIDIADIAVNWAPGDPLTYTLRASGGADPQRSLQDLEQAVAAAPADYRWRVALARGYEQSEQLDRAEAEFRKAIDLAPNYAHPHWYFGNYLLRRELPDQALAELSIAARNHLAYRDQVFSLLWDSFGRDADPLERVAGDNSEARAYAAYFLAGKGAGTDAVRLWNALSADQAEKYSFMLQPMAQALFNAGRFPAAMEFAAARVPGTLMRQSFTNGSFERPLPEPDAAIFDWKVERADPRVEITADSKTASQGTRSLKIIFRNFIRPVFANASQTLVVEPGARYEVEFAVKTEDLRTTSPLAVEVLNACQSIVVARSSGLPTGTTGWSRLQIPFTAGPSCSAVSVRVYRESCGEACPIVGTVLLDDFKLIRR